MCVCVCVYIRVCVCVFLCVYIYVCVVCVHHITYIHMYIPSAACPLHPPESSLTPLIHIHKSYHDTDPPDFLHRPRRFLHRTPPLRRQLRATACAHPFAAAAGMQHSSSSRYESQVIHVSVCVFVYLNLYIHTYIHTHIHTYIHTYIRNNRWHVYFQCSLPLSSARIIFDTIQRR
jgi:hypothetical protein